MRNALAGLSDIRSLVVAVSTGDPGALTGSEEFRYIDIASIDREQKVITNTSLLNIDEAPSRARQLVKAGDVLVSTVRPNLNAVAVVPDDLDGAIASTGFCVLRVEPREASNRYLFHWVRTSQFVNEMCRLATGASYPAVGDRIILNSQIPAPPAREQQRIAAILDKADAIRRKRQEARDTVQELLGSSYLKLFGDPRINVKGWDVKPLGAISSIERGRFTPRPRNDPRFYDGEYPFIQTGDISASGGILSQWKQTLNKDGTVVSRSFPAGTVVIAIVGATIGETAILAREMYCPDSVIGIIPHEGVATAEYLEFSLRFFKHIFREMAPETARANINLETLRPLRLSVPKHELQERFSDIFKKCYELNRKTSEPADGTMDLFDSLVQRAFRGDL